MFHQQPLESFLLLLVQCIREIILREAHAAESISCNVVLALDVGQLGTALFNDETPPHDALSVECLADQILVVGKDVLSVDLGGCSYAPLRS